MPIAQPVTAVFFDWDGTLQDSLPEQYKGFQAVFAAAGLPAPPFEFFCQNQMSPIEPWYRSLGIGFDEQRIIEIFRSTVNAIDCPLLPGVAECLNELSAYNVEIGVVSAGRGVLIKKVIEQRGLVKLFNVLVCDARDKVSALKTTCEYFGFEPGRCVYVGDLASDMMDGKKAGLMTAAFVGPHGSAKSFERVAPDAIVHSHDELQKALLPF